MFHNLSEFIVSVGYLGIFGIIFAESGLLFGFFFPGDSLLITAGLLASRGVFDIKILLVLITVAAILGDSAGYWFGKKTGKRIFKKEDSILFHKDHILKAKAFYEKHGGKTIILARFFPLIRTFAPIVAGVAEMSYKNFVTYNVVGGILWACGFTLLGFFLGNVIPDIDKYLLLILAIVIGISVAPTAIHLWKNHRKEIIAKLKIYIKSNPKS